MSSAARLYRSYSCSRRTSSARGSSSSSPASDMRGSSMRDLISASMAAISRYSPAKLQVQLLHELDVLHVLARDVRDRDVEDVEVLAPDQVEEQVERALERLEEHLERLRRDVEVARHLRSPARRPRSQTASRPAAAAARGRGSVAVSLDFASLAQRYSRPTASRTSDIVARAASRARSQPSATMPRTSSGFPSIFARALAESLQAASAPTR